MRMNLNVTYNDGTGADVIVSAPDLVAFERNFNVSMAVFASDSRIEHILWIAWHTLKRHGKTTQEFDPWMETVDQVSFGDSPQ